MNEYKRDRLPAMLTKNFEKKRKWYLLIPIIFWIIILACSFIWNMNTAQKGMEQTTLNIGRSFFKEIETARLWNAKHGGVYVPITDETKPNPYLDIPNRDVSTTSGINLTMINPAYMTRQISEIAKQESNIQYHITSLRPIRPANKADRWETKTLYKFEAGAQESFQFIKKAMVYRYMAPLFVKKACLKCHARQGYKLGDIRGGISVTIPAKIYVDAIQRSKDGLIWIHVIALFLGIGLLFFLTRFRDEQELKLHHKNKELEKEIVERKIAEVEKEKLETQLRQAQKMEAIGIMAGGIAHDFNNILAIIFGYSELLKGELPDHSPAKNDLEQILTASNRAKDLVRHIIRFSCISGQVQGHTPIDLASLLKEALKRQDAPIQAAIEVKVDIDENCGLINGDPAHIYQIITNFWSNALHAMEDNGGTLEVSLHKINLSADDLQTEPNLHPGTYIRLSVSDTGIGLTPELINKIFDPYFTTKEVGKGSGMGLSVVHGIVKNHGGFVKVEGNLGKGCTFNVFFPRLKERTGSEDNAQATYNNVD